MATERHLSTSWDVCVQPWHPAVKLNTVCVCVDAVSRQIEILELKDLEKEYVLARCRLTLAQQDPSSAAIAGTAHTHQHAYNHERMIFAKAVVMLCVCEQAVRRRWRWCLCWCRWDCSIQHCHCVKRLNSLSRPSSRDSPLSE